MRYPQHIKQEAIRRVQEGELRVVVAQDMGILYTTVAQWARGIDNGHKGRSGIRGMTLQILQRLVTDGYFFPGKGQHTVTQARTLRKYLPVRKVSSSGMIAWYLKGREREAMEALMKRRNTKVLAPQEICLIRKAFGIRRHDRKGIQ